MGTIRISEFNTSPATTFTVEGDLLSQSIAGNYSVIRCYLSAYNGPGGTTGSFMAGAGVQTGTIAGVKEFARRQASSNFLPSGYANGATRWRLGPYDVQVPHNSDGTRAPIRFGMVLNYSSHNETLFSADMALPTIPRATKATFSPSATFDAGSAATISLPRASSLFTHDVTYRFGSATGTVATGAGVSASWTPPLSLLSQIPDSVSGAGTITVVTKNGSTTIGSSTTAFTLRTPASVTPTVSAVTYVDQNSDVASIVGRVVRGLSVLKLTVNGAGVYGSSIVSGAVQMGANTVASGGTLPVPASGSITLTGRVTDSRGRTGSGSASLSALDYTAPQVTAYQVRRSNSAGTLVDDGSHLRVDLSAAVQSLINSSQRNAMTIRVYTRPHGTGAWTARNVITPGLTYNSFVVITGGGIYSPTSSWDVRVRVEDKFNVYIADTTVSTASVTLDLNGKAVGVGKIHEQGAMDVGPGGIYDNGNLVVNAALTATTGRRGIVELATNAETTTGSDTARAATPAGVKAAIDAYSAAYETPWTNITTFSTGITATPGYPPQVRRVGTRVEVRGAVSLVSGGSLGSLFTVPALFRPTANRWVGTFHGSISGSHGQLLIEPTGLIQIPSAYRDGSAPPGLAVPLAGFWHID